MVIYKVFNTLKNGIIMNITLKKILFQIIITFSLIGQLSAFNKQVFVNNCNFNGEFGDYSQDNTGINDLKP